MKLIGKEPGTARRGHQSKRLSERPVWAYLNNSRHLFIPAVSVAWLLILSSFSAFDLYIFN